MKAVYLAGPINGCSDQECFEWRQRAKQLLSSAPYDVFDPMDRDFRGLESMSAKEIVTFDLHAIAACDFLLVNASRPSWGTAMEIVRAWDDGKKVVAFADTEFPSPWLIMHTHAIVQTLEAAIVVVMNFEFLARARQ